MGRGWGGGWGMEMGGGLIAPAGICVELMGLVGIEFLFGGWVCVA